MKKRNFLSFACVLFAFVMLFSTSVFAVTKTGLKTEPFYYSKCLPLIFGGTLLIEAIIIILFSDIKRLVNVSFAVFVANIASFVVIRLSLGILRHGVFYVGLLMKELTIKNLFVVFCCLAVSLVIELPIVWKMLKDFTKKTKWLLFVTVIANVVSLAATCAVDLMLSNSFVVV